MILRLFTIGMALCTLGACSTVSGSIAGEEASGLELNVMSFNIRFDSPNDGANSWQNRKSKTAQVFLNEKIDIAGTQEVRLNQLDDLKSYLTGYSTVGVGRNGGNSGEFNPIFYRTKRLKLIDSGTFWLSETPDAAGSKGWDAALPRIATWGLFEIKSSGKRFFFINTHLDHRGQTARVEGIKLILKKITSLHQGLPVILSGDLNATPESEVISLILDPANPIPLVHARDAAETAEGSGGTSHGFVTNPMQFPFIDYIFVSREFKVNLHRIMPAKLDGIFVSDHCPVVGKVYFE